jgi:hypothetical protein
LKLTNKLFSEYADIEGNFAHKVGSIFPFQVRLLTRE